MFFIQDLSAALVMRVNRTDLGENDLLLQNINISIGEYFRLRLHDPYLRKRTLLYC